MKDVKDGVEYQNIVKSGFLKEPYNLVLSFNTDGVSPYKSSKLQIWPIYLQVLNLPPAIRNESRFLKVTSLWFGKSKPNLNILFQLFVQEINDYKGSEM